MKVYIIDSSGVFIRTEEVDPMGPQPIGAVYKEIPEISEGSFLVWRDKEWVEISKEDLPTFEITEPAKEVPAEVTMAQCRLALFDKHGVETDEQFYGLVDILPEDARPRARVELRTRPSVRYDNPLVIAFCEARGWDRDELFIYAADQ